MFKNVIEPLIQSVVNHDLSKERERDRTRGIVLLKISKMYTALSFYTR